MKTLSLLISAIFLVVTINCCKNSNSEKKSEISKNSNIEFDKIDVINPNDVIKNNIELKLKEVMHNPESFEFVNMVITDTFSVKNRREVLNDETYKKIIDNPYTSSQMHFLTKELYSYLQKQTDENKDAIYYIDFNARGTNTFGAKVLNNYSVTVLNDENYTILLLK